MAYVLDFSDVDVAQAARVGGKGRVLAELSRMEGIQVPGGFCVTTDAYGWFMSQVTPVGDLIDQLSQRRTGDTDEIAQLSAEARAAIESTAVPDDLAAEVTDAVSHLGPRAAWAVRSSATAEDLPTASFAGQLDSFLNVIGPAEVLAHVRRCWASLFTERAVSYRRRGGFDHREVRMAVVVQRMILADASGVLFTADPLTGHRRIASVEAAPGLGEALVSGAVSPDRYTVAGDAVTAVVADEREGRGLLADGQVRELVRLGRRIEDHFGCPQDIEWCLTDDGFSIVQSRPITTLFPIPEAADGERHVYASVGHQQMMTEAMRPLGLSVWRATALAPMEVAGSRLFVDVTRRLASPASRDGLLALMRRTDPLTADALATIVRRGDLPTLSPAPDPPAPAARPATTQPAEIDTDPAIVRELIERDRASVVALAREIEKRSGPALFDYLPDAFAEHRRNLGDPRSVQAIMAGMQAAWWLADHLEEWLGEKGVVDTLTQSAPGNITSEMGLALLDVADAIRPHGRVVAFLRDIEAAGCEDDAFLEEMTAFPGGTDAQEAIGAYLERYGMRCVGEIDITRPRWSERPAGLLGVILATVDSFAPGESRRRWQKGERAADAKRHEVRERLRALPDGDEKAGDAERMIERVRTFAGYREYPKYGIVSRYLVYRQALMREAERLVADGVIAEAQDVFFLTVEELGEVVRTRQADGHLIARRRAQFAADQTLSPPRVLTSDGEAVAGAYHDRESPDGALVGLGVSAGTAEGRARVVLDIAQADLGPGDILVTRFTDPSWTPLFLTVRGLVTEVGGLMTHGAVIAREYGLPAVVGVPDATRLIEDGVWIRVHGTDGYVEILADDGEDRRL